jgi:aromatase
VTDETEAAVTQEPLSLPELGELVLAGTGVEADTAALAAAPATVEELGIDSLGWLGVVTQLENRYGIDLGDAAETVDALPDLVVLVNRTVAGDTPGHTDNRVVIGAPMELVWSMTNDVPSWPRLFSEYSEATVLERSGATVRFRLSTHPDADGNVYSWVSERTPDPVTRTVAARRVEPGIFTSMVLSWSYREVAGGVEMRWVQDFGVRPDAPADLAGVTAFIDRNSVLQMARIAGLVEAAHRAADPVPTR